MKIEASSAIDFSCGKRMKNRFSLAPLTNQQSNQDGTLSDQEFNWLTMRAKGQFGLVMTCAAHVQEVGKGFAGQLGIFSDDQIIGHQRLTKSIKQEGSLAIIQLHHAGMRSPKEQIHQNPVSASNVDEFDARALTLTEVHRLRDDFIKAAVRSKKSGYDGVEVHGAHGYILTQFLSADINHRTDEYGGSLENRSRLMIEIVDGIRDACGDDFMVGIRLSPERFGMNLLEVKQLAERLIVEGNIDFLDISLWDCFKLPEDEKYQDKTLIAHFTELNRENVKLTVAGKIAAAQDVQKVLDAGVDFVSIGKSAILHHDFPVKVMEDVDFKPTSIPVSKSYLKAEGLSEPFITYMNRWPGFVQEE